MIVLVPILALVTSTITAVFGLGGGIILIALMRELLPAPVVIPVHGIAQLASNSSRWVFAPRHVRWELVWPFAIGAAAGAVGGAFLVRSFDWDLFPIVLGVLILVAVWVRRIPAPLSGRAAFIFYGALQTFLSLFVGVVTPLNKTAMLRLDLTRDEIVVTHGAHATLVHLGKIVVFGAVGLFSAEYALMGALVATGAVVGSLLGTWLRPLIPEERFRWILKALLTVLAVRLLVLGVIDLAVADAE
jgi:uncharacterized protein